MGHPPETPSASIPSAGWSTRSATARWSTRMRGPYGVMVTEEHVGPTSDPTLRDLSEALVVVDGTDYGVRSPSGSPASRT